MTPTRQQLLAKSKLRALLYMHNGQLRHGGLTRCAKALSVSPSTVRNWCVPDIFWPSEVDAKRILGWVSTKPKIFHKAGRPRTVGVVPRN